jgi:hypothetical protein
LLFFICTVQNFMKWITWSLSDCIFPCLILTKSVKISDQNKSLACSLEELIEITNSFLRNGDFCFGGKFKLVKNFELCMYENPKLLFHFSFCATLFFPKWMPWGVVYVQDIKWKLEKETLQFCIRQLIWTQIINFWWVL